MVIYYSPFTAVLVTFHTPLIEIHKKSFPLVVMIHASGIGSVKYVMKNFKINEFQCFNCFDL